jgi:hypothetical protein
MIIDIEKQLLIIILFPLYPQSAIKNRTYNKDVSLIISNNDYKQPMCFQYLDMNSTYAIVLLTQSVVRYG